MATESSLESPLDPVLQEDLDLLAATPALATMAGSTLAVSGATGLIGSLLVKAVLCANRRFNAGIRVLALARNPTKVYEVFAALTQRPEVQFVYTNLASPNATVAAQIKESVDYLVHAGAPTESRFFITNPVETIHAIVRGTDAMLELAQVKQVTSMVYLSSMEVYGLTDPSLASVGENDLGFIDPLSPRSCYPQAKRLAESLCAAYQAEHAVAVSIARLAQTFGPGVALNETRVFGQFARSVLTGQDLVLHTTGATLGNYCYTRDAIGAVLLLLSRGARGEAYTIVNEDCTVSIRELAALVAERVAAGHIHVVIDLPEDPFGFGYAPYSQTRLSAAKVRALGWAPQVGLEEAFTRMVASLRNRHVSDI